MVESIREVGLLHPVVVDSQHNLIAGERRIRAVQALGWNNIPVHIVDLKDLLKGEFHENTFRKTFTTSERVAIERSLGPEIQKTRIGHRLSTEEEKKGDNLSPFPKGKTREIVAAFAGVSAKTLQKEKAIVEAAEKNPDDFSKVLEKVDNGKMSIDRAFKKVQRAQKNGDTPPLPKGEFDIIYADPPWQYDLNFLDCSPDSHYKTRTVEDIAALAVPSCENAVLFLWSTNPMLENALNVMKAWGFSYKTNLVWVKNRMGVGCYFRGQHELLLVGVKGKVNPPEESRRFSSLLNADVGKHSKKPEQVYSLIELMYPERKYLELFAREKREGWEAWGNEV